jgi:hypothetical protein
VIDAEGQVGEPKTASSATATCCAAGASTLGEFLSPYGQVLMVI